MKRKVIQTIVHLKDDKGWENEILFDGEYICGNIYRITKPNRDLKMIALESIHEPEVQKMIQYYEFNLEKSYFTQFSKGYYIKHIFFQMYY